MAARKKFLGFNQEQMFARPDVEDARVLALKKSEAMFTVRLFAQRSERAAYRKSWSCKMLKLSEEQALGHARDYVARIGRMAGLQNEETTFVVERNGVVHEYFDFVDGGFRCVKESDDEQG